MTRAKEMRDLPLAIDATASGNVGIGGTANEYSNYTTLTINHNTSGGILDIERNGNLVGELYTLSANQGDARAQYNLGVCYGNGDGVEQDMKKIG